MSDTTQHDLTYADLVLAGLVHYSEIDDFISQWHQAAEGSKAASLEVFEFLGLDWEEYRLWGEQPSSLKYIFAARKAQLPIDEVLRSSEQQLVAARASDENDAAKVYEWLVARGRIGPDSAGRYH